MGRRQRFSPAGIPQHIVQRGNNRIPCFLCDGDRARYRHLLGMAASASGCRIHAYVFMSNHVHLLATADEEGAAGRMMQALGTRYVRYFNDRHGRTGTLWEGRFRSCLVDTEGYVLRCMRYIELNPVRAGMTRAPEDHPWSSYRWNALGIRDGLVSSHPAFLRLGADDATRRLAYRAIVGEGCPVRDLGEIRERLAAGTAWGSAHFVRTLHAGRAAIQE